MKNKQKIIIIGAGAAGLYAAYTLAQRGIDFQILEATDRLGGRLGKIDDFADYPLDTGAQWLHGKKSL
ncbi:MAG: FAD-dependent oxidoreductase, partial [Bacteroidota bacterium]